MCVVRLFVSGLNIAHAQCLSVGHHMEKRKCTAPKTCYHADIKHAIQEVT